MKRNADPVDPAFAEEMQVLGQFLDQQFNGPPPSPRLIGFVLLSFRMDDPEGDEHQTNYISSADLADVIAMLQTFLVHARKRLAADRRDKLQ